MPDADVLRLVHGVDKQAPHKLALKWRVCEALVVNPRANTRGVGSILFYFVEITSKPKFKRAIHMIFERLKTDHCWCWSREHRWW